MKCIYTVFYKNLKSYDGKDTNMSLRIKVLELCIKSFKICNPDIKVIVEYVDGEIQNTTDMYFDKMRRIKEMNYVYDVLWVDGDTLCLENISEIFTNKMQGVFWGWWDGFNLINGGVVYYPRRFLYDRWDIFVTDWINLLSKLNSEGKKFIGPFEQIPITNLLLSQLGGKNDSMNYSIFSNFKNLNDLGFLLDWKYNYNPIIMNVYNNGDDIYNIHSNCIVGKKLLHINATTDSFKNMNVVHFFEYIIDNLLGYTSNFDLSKNRSEFLKINNDRLEIEKTENKICLKNTTYSYIKIILFTNDELNMKMDSEFYTINPGFYFEINIDKKVKKILIKNMFSGEQTILSI